MALVEIEDTKIAEFNKRLADAETWQRAWTKVVSGKNKIKAWELFKEEHPDVPIEGLDWANAAAEPLRADLAAARAEFAEYKAEQEKKEAERAERDREHAAKATIGSSRRKLKGDGWDDEGIEKIEALMQERGIGDYDVAAAYVRSQIPTPSPLANDYAGKDLNWFNPGEDEPDSKLLMENPTKFKSDMVKKFFSDRQTGNTAAWAA